MTDNDEVRRNEIAARLIARHIARLSESFHEIDALNYQCPLAPVGTSWDTFRHVAMKMSAMIKIFDGEKENG